jgi:hypothetical protein
MKKISAKLLRERSMEGAAAQGGLLAKSLMLRDTGINPKAYHYWRTNGLVSLVEDSTWTEISFIEYLWLKILESMRGFGCPISLMRKIYYDQFLHAYEMNLAELNRKDKIAYYRGLSKIRPLESFEEEALKKLEEFEQDHLIGIFLRTQISFFYQLVIDCLERHQDLSLVIYPDETYEFTFDINAVRQSNRPHIFISLYYFISQMLEDEGKDDFVSKTGIFSEVEMHMIRELRNKNVDRIIISFHEDGRVKNIDYDEKGLLQGEKVKEVMRILGLRNFDSVTLNIRNGTTLSFTKTGKNRI